MLHVPTCMYVLDSTIREKSVFACQKADIGKPGWMSSATPGIMRVPIVLLAFAVQLFSCITNMCQGLFVPTKFFSRANCHE